MSNHPTSTDIDNQSGDNRDRLRNDDPTTTIITNITKKSSNQLGTIGKLFQACINSDITTMENIIKIFETNRELFMNKKSSSMNDTSDSEEDDNIDDLSMNDTTISKNDDDDDDLSMNGTDNDEDDDDDDDDDDDASSMNDTNDNEEDDDDYFDDEFYYNRPLIEQTYNIDSLYDIPQFEYFEFTHSLLDAAVLSNSPKTIDFVFKVCKLKGYGHISFWKSDSCYSLGIGLSALLLALATGKLNSVKHLIDEYSAQFLERVCLMLEYLIHPDRLQQLKFFIENSPCALSALNDPTFQCDCLRSAIESRNDALIQYIVDLGISIDTPDDDGHSALYTYVHNFQWDMVEYLINRFNANWNLRCSFDCDSEKCWLSLLSVALSDPDLTIETFDFIINHIGVESSIDDIGGQTPLLLTAATGKLLWVKRLINHHHANINATCGLGRTLLHYAVKSNNLDLVQHIVDDPMFNFDINVLDGVFDFVEECSYTPLSMNVNHISLDIVKFMVEHKSDIKFAGRGIQFYVDDDDEDDDDDFHLPQANILPLAAQNPDSNVIEYLFEQIGINQLTQHEIDQCLIESIKSTRLHTAQILIEKYNANRINNYEFPNNGNIFHFTLQYNNSGSSIRDFIHFLQPTKEELEATNSKDQTPLFIAAKSGCDIECMKKLVECGANIHFINKTNNENVLHAILANEFQFYLDSSNYFLRDAESRARRAATQTAIDSCVKVLQYCIDSNVDVNSKCSTNGQTPLHYAAKLSNIDITQVLLENCANINEIDVDGNTPLCIAVISNRLFPLKTLIEHGANINIQNKKGQTAIHLGAWYFHYELIPTLARSNYNINIKDENGNTPLLLVPLSSSHSSMYSSHPQSATMRHLLRRQSDPTIMNNNGQTILHLMACTENHGLKDNGDILTSIMDSIVDCYIQE